MCQASKGQQNELPRNSFLNHRTQHGNDKVLNTICLSMQRIQRSDVRVLNNNNKHRNTFNNNSNS